MKTKIIARLKQIGKGYDLDKLPPALLNSVIESSIPLIEVERQKVPTVLTSLLNEYRIEDVGVQDRPLEEVIAEMFAATDDQIIK